MSGKKKVNQGLEELNLQGKIKSTACVSFIRISGRHGKHPRVSARCRWWVGGRGVGVDWDEVCNCEVKFRGCKCREKDRKKTLPEIEVSITAMRLQKLHQTTFLRPHAGTILRWLG